jgi:ferrous iron transport protein A
MKSKKTLSAMLPGEYGYVRLVGCSGAMKRRLCDIGLIPGTRVVCVGRSPLCDPSAYLVRGKTVAIRARDAKNIIL